MKVLIADDDPDQLSVRSMLLRESGFETLEAVDPESALGAASAHEPRCAVIDLRIPTEQAGLKLLQALKTRFPSMHVFVLTGQDFKSRPEPPELRWADQVFQKGSTTGRLVHTLKAVERSNIG